jgi:hypothetical protein
MLGIDRLGCFGASVRARCVTRAEVDCGVRNGLMVCVIGVL